MERVKLVHGMDYNAYEKWRFVRGEFWNMPKLYGTERQVSWANDIRIRLIGFIADKLAFNDVAAKGIDILAQYIDQTTDAKTWIHIYDYIDEVGRIMLYAAQDSDMTMYNRLVANPVNLPELAGYSDGQVVLGTNAREKVLLWWTIWLIQGRHSIEVMQKFDRLVENYATKHTSTQHWICLGDGYSAPRKAYKELLVLAKTSHFEE